MYSSNIKPNIQSENPKMLTLLESGLLYDKIEKLNKRDSLELIEYIIPENFTPINNRAKQRFTFKLNDKQVVNIMRYRTIAAAKPNYNLKLLLRVGMITNRGDCIRFHNIYENYTVQLNDKVLKNPKMRPINLTPALKILPEVDNVLEIKYHTPHVYISKIFLAKNFSAPNIPMITSNLRPLFFNYAEIISDTKKLFEFNGHERNVAEILSYEISVICPIKQQIINCPCRGEECSHLNCFDLTGFLEIYSRKTKWFCPICGKLIKPEKLTIDRNMKKLLTQAPKGCTTIIINKDGTWFPKLPNDTYVNET
ncbi:hypothetical protein O3M35_001015 [Rhynocoris fuscipes]|uniref:SP-RING-type domain-containing protein n=1 Tax=Rhynocoris fuscipes TaxID=488301 RepID=A0AAW1DPS4_9HEMI